MIYFFVLLAQVASYILQDHANGGSLSASGTSQYIDVTFSGTFERVPQVALALSKLNMNPGNVNGFDITITSITTTKFRTEINCIYASPAGTAEFAFHWFAYDDRRIQIINEFNYELTGYTSGFTKLKTYKHDNPNFSKAFVSVLSLHYIGAVDFDVTIDSLTKTDVTVKIRSGNANLIKVGYCIYLGTDSVIQIQNQITSNDIIYTNPTSTFPSGWALGVMTQGFGWNQMSQSITLQAMYYSNYFTYGSWTSYQATQMTITAVFLAESIGAGFVAMNGGHLRISQLEVPDATNLPQIQLVANSIGQTYSTIPSSNRLIFDKTPTQVNVVLKYSCISKEALNISVRYSATKTTTTKLYCLKQQNLISIYLTFKPLAAPVKDLKLDITSSSIILQQRLLNIIESFVPLASVQIIN